MEELKDYINKELSSEYSRVDQLRAGKDNRNKTFHQGMISAYEEILEKIEDLEEENDRI